MCKCTGTPKIYLENKMRDTFYKTDKDRDIELLTEALEKSYEYFIDEIPSGKISRVRSNKTFDEIIEIYKRSGYKQTVFIIREPMYEFDKRHIECGVSILLSNEDISSYYIFIELDMDHLSYFVDKYGLTILN